MAQIPIVPNVGDWVICRDSCVFPVLVVKVKDAAGKFIARFRCGIEVDYPFLRIEKIVAVSLTAAREARLEEK